MDGVATKQKKPRRATLVEPELLESDSEANTGIAIRPTTLQRLREITLPPFGLGAGGDVGWSCDVSFRSGNYNETIM